jgi:hypothetical protein
MAEHGSDLRVCVRAAITELLGSKDVEANTKRLFQQAAQHDSVTRDIAAKIRGARGSLGAVLAQAEAQRPRSIEAWLVARAVRCLMGKVGSDAQPKLNGTPITVA